MYSHNAAYMRGKFRTSRVLQMTCLVKDELLELLRTIKVCNFIC